MFKKINFFALFFISLSLFLTALFCIVTFSYLKKRNLEFENVLEDRNYHILVTGDYENHLFLSQVFKGAQKISSDYNSIVELYVPQSYAQNESLQHLFDFASFANVDAVIACISQNEDISELKVPLKKDSKPIPLITIGSYHSQIPQVAFVGINYSEMGKKTAEEAAALAKKDGLIFLIQSEMAGSGQTSNFINSFYSRLQKENLEKRINLIESIPYENELLRTYFPDQVQNPRAVFITLSEMAAVQTTQLVTAFQTIKADIISVGNSEIIENLFERGSISEIIAVDPEKIGNLALKEIFEYLALRYSNNYITAEVQVRKHMETSR